MAQSKKNIANSKLPGIPGGGKWKVNMTKLIEISRDINRLEAEQKREEESNGFYKK